MWLPAGWSAVPNGYGSFYYWNEVTDEVTWDKPKRSKQTATHKYDDNGDDDSGAWVDRSENGDGDDDDDDGEYVGSGGSWVDRSYYIDSDVFFGGDGSDGDDDDDDNGDVGYGCGKTAAAAAAQTTPKTTTMTTVATATTMTTAATATTMLTATTEATQASRRQRWRRRPPERTRALIHANLKAAIQKK
jgi:hypothetical protein